MSKTSNIKRQFKGLAEEEAKSKAKELALRQELAFWRRECLKKFRDMENLGNFEPSEIV